jgi:hypothetical protein
VGPHTAEGFRAHKAELLARLFGTDANGPWPFGAQVSSAAALLARRTPMAGNVVGLGIGAKVTDEHVTQDVALRVYVRNKLARAELRQQELVPDTVGDLPTDVVAVGDVTALGRPVRGGASIGHPDISAGTLACLVAIGDEPFILSNNHVLANVNRAALGDPILEPGPADGGTEPIAELSDF